MSTVSVLNTDSGLSAKTLNTLESDQTITGAKTYDRDPSPPFIVTSGSAKVANLDADKLNGSTWGAIAEDIVLATGGNSIRRSTADAADNGVIALAGGGSASQTRGAYINVYGNENAELGGMYLFPGNVNGSQVRIVKNDGNPSVVFDGQTGLLTLTHGQLAFPAAQNASTSVNVLDDYEEGSWTPVISGSGGTSGQVYSTQEGRYIKIGSMVWAAFHATLSTLGTITGNVQITPLPFTAETGVLQFYGGHVNWTAMTTAVVSIPCYVTQNTAVIALHKHTGANVSSVSTSLAQADLSATTALRGFVIYRASA